MKGGQASPSQIHAKRHTESYHAMPQSAIVVLVVPKYSQEGRFRISQQIYLDRAVWKTEWAVKNWPSVPLH